MVYQKKFIYKIFDLLRWPAKAFLNFLFKKLNLTVLWRIGSAIGDNLLMTGFAKILSKKTNRRVIVITHHSDLIKKSPFVYKTINWKNIKYRKILYYFLKFFEGEEIVEYTFPISHYGFKDFHTAKRHGLFNQFDNPPIWRLHVADRYSKEYFSDFSGALISSKDSYIEKLIKDLKKAHPMKRIGVINPHGKTKFTKLKQFGFRNYQKIVNMTKDKFIFIQVGLRNEECLNSIDFDARGKTLPFLVNLISYCDFVLADEGLNNHIASSFTILLLMYPTLFLANQAISLIKIHLFLVSQDIKRLKKEVCFSMDDKPSKYLIDVKYIANQIISNEENIIENQLL